MGSTDPAGLQQVNAYEVATSGAAANTALATSAAEEIAARVNRREVIIKNIDSTITTYVGFDSNLTTSNGMELLAGESISLKTNAAIYGIAASGTPAWRYVELYG